jgi:hypothetical protein
LSKPQYRNKTVYSVIIMLYDFDALYLGLILNKFCFGF